MNVITHLPRNGVVAEIGVDNGGYSARILQLNLPKKLHLIDPWADDSEYVLRHRPRGKTMAERYEAVKTLFAKDSRVEIHRGYSNDVSPTFDNDYFDWVFVDGLHTYEACLRDLRDIDSKVKPEGFILGHDFANYSRDGFGVIGAVLDFMAERPGYRLEFVTMEPAPSYVISKSPDSNVAQKFRETIILANTRIVEVPNEMARKLYHEKIVHPDGKKHVKIRFA